MSLLSPRSAVPGSSGNSSSRNQGIVFGCLALLIGLVFSQQIFDGDSYDFYGRAIVGDLNVDPNHLLMGPVAYLAAKIVAGLGWGSVFGAFKLISAISVAVSMYGFALLFRLCGVHNRERSVLALSGILVSYYFTYSLLCEEFYVIQLPFLTFGACFLVQTLDQSRHREAVVSGAAAGFLFALAALVNIHNVVLCISLSLLLLHSSVRGCRVRAFLAYSVAGTVVGVTGLVWAYLATGADASMVSWLSSYAGEPGSQLDDMYGINWTVSGVPMAAARTIFSLLEAIAYLGNLPAYLKGMGAGGELEFAPSFIQLVLAAAMVVLAAILWLVVAFRLVSTISSDKSTRFAFAWLLAYVLFGFYWDQKVAQFWFPVVPVFWLLLLKAPTAVGASPEKREASDLSPGPRAFIIASIVLLFANNYGNAFNPNARTDMQQISSEYLEVIGDSSLVISPGWGMPWINHLHRQQQVDALYLMELAFEKDGAVRMQNLPAAIDKKLDSGERVFVNRLYDKDSNPRPWSDLENLSWPRSRILTLLEAYCVGEAHSVSLLQVRELTKCEL